MKKFIVLLIGLLTYTQLTAQNVLISSANNPNEPSIAVDPNHTNVIIAASNLDNYYISVDTGHTWKAKKLTSTYGVWGDPVISVDANSNFYFFHLSNPSSGSWIDRIVCQKSTNNGSTFSNGSFAGLNGTKAQDKHWCAIDKTNNNMYITWTQFDKYDSSTPSHKSNILFSKSTDAGSSWSAPVKINSTSGDCLDDDNTVEGAVPAVGPNGEIYVSWAGPDGLIFNKSLDQGKTWLSQELKICPIPSGWAYSISGISRANGLPIICCDLSNGPNRGTLYVNWSDQRNGATNTDIWLVKSTDGGKTWSQPARVNDDTSNRQQFFTWMAIDQTNGYLYFVFYDRRNYSGDQTDVYMALSIDGGKTFINRKISDSPFTPSSGVFFGDYTNLTVHNGVIRPIWTRLNSGSLSVWTDMTRLSDFIATTGIESPKAPDNLTFENYPNPTSDCEYVSFKLHTTATINLSVYDVNGKLVAEIIKNEIRGYGKYIEEIALHDLHIPDGTYFLKLQIDGKVKVNRLVKL